MEFQILKKSKISRARLGVLKTLHGSIETPSLVPVATQAVIKTLTSEQVIQTKTQILIANTFHLHLKPGENFVKQAGGLNKFMNWPRPLMTDSGGFQVFSLGFGRDLGVGKILKYFPGRNQKEKININSKPRKLKITEAGVHFQSPIDGQKLFIGPKESMKIQEMLGANIVFAFDECTPPLSTAAYVEEAIKRTHNWAKICLKNKKSNQAIYGIIQGSKFKDLRIESAKFINSLGFDGFGIGGDLGEDSKAMLKIINWIMPDLDERKPRHLLGIGRIENIEAIIKCGIDTFDCTVPTHYARHGIAFVSGGKLNLRLSEFLKNKNPLDKKCGCQTCQNYKINYIAHLVRAGEMTGLSLITSHNLYFFNNFIEEIRKKIRENKI